MAGWVRLYQEDTADPGALLRVVESLVLKFNEEHGSQINCYASSVPVRFRLCAVEKTSSPHGMLSIASSNYYEVIE